MAKDFGIVFVFNLECFVLTQSTSTRKMSKWKMQYVGKGNGKNMMRQQRNQR